MSLPVLAAMVVVGIAAIVIAVHLTGGSRPARLADEAHARRRFAEDFPDERVDDLVLTQDGRTGFLMLAGSRTGIVHSFGDRFLTRIIGSGDILAMDDSERGFTLRFRDFTWKGGAFRFADAADAMRAKAVLEPKKTIGAE